MGAMPGLWNAVERHRWLRVLTQAAINIRPLNWRPGVVFTPEHQQAAAGSAARVPPVAVPVGQ
jgi:hypothetical protein